MHQCMFFFIGMVVWGLTIAFICENNSNTVCGGGVAIKASLMPQYFPYCSRSKAKPALRLQILCAEWVDGGLSHSSSDHLWKKPPWVIVLGCPQNWVTHRLLSCAWLCQISLIGFSPRLLNVLLDLLAVLTYPDKFLHISPTSVHRAGLASFPPSLLSPPRLSSCFPFSAGVVLLILTPFVPYPHCLRC